MANSRKFLFVTGVVCLVVSACCLILLLLCVYPRYLMADLLHAMRWEAPTFVLGMSAGIVWALITPTGIALIRESRGQRGALLPLRAGLLFALAAYVIAFPILTKIPERPRMQSCRSHQQMIYLAIMMYSQDHGDRLPDNWEELASYGVSPDTLICPETTRYFHQKSGYGFNALLCGKSLKKIADSNKILFIADAVSPQSYLKTRSDIDVARHESEQRNQRGFIGTFLDGHTMFIPEDAVIRLK